MSKSEMTGPLPAVQTMKDQLIRITAESDRLACEVDEVGEALTSRGVPVPRSKPLAWSVAQLADELVKLRQLLAHAVMMYGEDATMAFPASLVAISAQRPLQVYENRDRGVIVMSGIDITTDQTMTTCPHCEEPTSALLPVCLQCGRTLADTVDLAHIHIGDRSFDTHNAD